MAFGQVDSVENHVTRERKAITTIDMDKEYGTGNLIGTGTSFDSNIIKKELEEYRQFALDSIKNTDPSWGSKDYDMFIKVDGNTLSWNMQSLESLDLTKLSSIRAHIERIVESNINPLNNISSL